MWSACTAQITPKIQPMPLLHQEEVTGGVPVEPVERREQRRLGTVRGTVGNGTPSRRAAYSLEDRPPIVLVGSRLARRVRAAVRMNADTCRSENLDCASTEHP
jgi:hypothetical protein